MILGMTTRVVQRTQRICFGGAVPRNLDWRLDVHTVVGRLDGSGVSGNPLGGPVTASDGDCTAC